MHGCDLQVTSLAGTPVYMAPEAVDSMMGQKNMKDVITPALDMWSAGVALYMLVGGFPPFEGKTSKVVALRAPSAPLSLRCIASECLTCCLMHFVFI